MNQSDNEFLELYKRTDRLCAETYSTRTGVTDYISQMEELKLSGKRRVSGWEDTYYTLKHLRWLRNQLVHEVDPRSSSKTDLEKLERFYHRLAEGTDPLAQLLHGGRGKKTPVLLWLILAAAVVLGALFLAGRL